MTPPIRTTGNSHPHVVHTGYQSASRHSSRWERRFLWADIARPIGGALLIALAIAPWAYFLTFIGD